MMTMAELEALKYRDLQRMAKEAGVKANLPKNDLIEALLENKAGGQEERVASEVVESELDKTFEMSETEQNVLNETFEKEVILMNSTFDKDNENNASLETLDNSKDNSKFVEFMEAESTPDTTVSKRKTRSQELMPLTPSSATLIKTVMGGGPRRSMAATPQDYLSKKNKTPLRKTSKTPGSIQKTSKTPGSIQKTSKTPGSIQKCKASQIPRFVEFARKRKAGALPNFAKMHEKNFNKMESLDIVVEKKKKLTESVTKNKLTDTVTKQLDQAKALGRDHDTIVKKIKEKSGAAKGFVPSVTSTARMNLNFGQGVVSKDPPVFGKVPKNLPVFQFSAAPVAAAARQLPKQRRDLKSVTKDKKTTPGGTKVASIRERLAAAAMKAAAKPLANITNDKSIGGTPGKKFDLKASLSKPLSYQPHKGKLKALDTKEMVVENVVIGKEQQMHVIKGVRMNRRAELLMQKRNMV